jgi:ABC-2 type transport system ATP-binding protein
MSKTLIHTQNLTRDFKTSSGTLRAVDGLNLEIPEGIVFGFLGPNGSGKTTTIRLLLGLLEPSAGSASIFGLNTLTQADQIRMQTGALLEHTGLYERLSAADNLDYYARIYHLPASQRQARIRELLEAMGLWERRAEIVNGWSRGMKQKLAVARALLHHPRLIFLDEPTAGLDPLAAAALRDDLAQLASTRQATIFLTTHNLTDAERLCQQVAVIRAGKLLATGAPNELRAQMTRRNGSQPADIFGHGFTPEMVSGLAALPQVRAARLEEGRLALELEPGAEMGPIVSQVVQVGGMVEEVRKGTASLEDAFLDLVEE